MKSVKTRNKIVKKCVEHFRRIYSVSNRETINIQFTTKFCEDDVHTAGTYCPFQDIIQIYQWKNLSGKELVLTISHELIHWYQKHVTGKLGWGVFEGIGVVDTWEGKPCNDELPHRQRPEEKEAYKLCRPIVRSVYRDLKI
jgi:hypothetical protein